jgi:hypothetical protein
MSEDTSNRKDILLRAAFDLLRRANMGPYVEHAPDILIRYDEANYDGQCLMEDIASELGFDANTHPIPLGKDYE